MILFKLIPFFISFTICADNISFLKSNTLQNSLHKSFWYLNFFKQAEFPTLTGKSVNVAIIDSEFKGDCPNCIKIDQITQNLSCGESCRHALIKPQEKKDLCAYLTKKNHVYCTLQIIRQLAPKANIISIPGLDHTGYSDKETIYNCLKVALRYKPDILHLGFQILDFDITQKLDKKIYQLLKSFKCIIVPIGNNIHTNFPPKLSHVWTVASFGKRDHNLPISSFCHKTPKADFIMPGENLLVKILDNGNDNWGYCPVSGTSFASALMTGFVALLFEKNNKKTDKTWQNLIKSSSFLDDTWQDAVRYGFPHFE